MAADPSTPTRSERRRHRRNQTSAIATVNYDRVLLPCFIADVSAGGARIKLLEPARLPKGPTVLEARQLGKVPAELVWQKGLFAGLRFAEVRPALADPARPAAAATPQPANEAPAPTPCVDAPRLRIDPAPPAASRANNRATVPA
jgi:hypothetical protein